MVLINLHRNLHEKSSFLSEIMFIRINPYLCHLLTRYQSTIFPNHKSCVRKKGVPIDDTPSFYSPVRKEPRDKKQKNRKIQDKQGQAHDRAPKKRSQERESETKPKQKKRGDYRHSYSYSYSYSSTLPSGLLRHELRNVSEPAKENPAHIECGVFFSQILKTAKSEP